MSREELVASYKSLIEERNKLINQRNNVIQKIENYHDVATGLNRQLSYERENIKILENNQKILIKEVTQIKEKLETSEKLTKDLESEKSNVEKQLKDFDITKQALICICINNAFLKSSSRSLLYNDIALSYPYFVFKIKKRIINISFFNNVKFCI